MSRDASVSLDWADGTYVFRLGWGELMELQERVDAGPFVVLQRVQTGAWRVEDLAHIIRLGLIGGGMAPGEALRLTRAYVEARPPGESVLPAQAIIGAGVFGAPEEEAAKKNAKARRSRSTTSRTGRSASQPSSAPAPPSA